MVARRSVRAVGEGVAVGFRGLVRAAVFVVRVILWRSWVVSLQLGLLCWAIDFRV